MDYINNTQQVYPTYGVPYYQPQGQPTVFNQAIPQPTFTGSLSEEEIQLISQKKPNKIDINISREDHVRAMCNHKHNGVDVAKRLQDGRMWCPICNAVWHDDPADKEDIEAAIDLIYDQMQNAKWVGEFNVDMIRDYFPIIELLKKFPDVYEYAVKTFDKYKNAGMYQNASDAAIYNQFNAMIYGTPTPTMPYAQAGYYGQPQQPYYGQQYTAQPQQPGYAPQGYQQVPQGAPANPMVNPMQAPVNPQFADQANMMMQGGYYGQPQQPYTGYAPLSYGQPQQAAPASAPTVANQTAPAADANGDATTSSTVQIQ